MGNQALSRPLQHVIRERVDIRWVRDRLLRGPSEVHRALDALMERTVVLGAT
jgi:hypothetical protein